MNILTEKDIKDCFLNHKNIKISEKQIIPVSKYVYDELNKLRFIYLGKFKKMDNLPTYFSLK